jgi:hypothetical protein
LQGLNFDEAVDAVAQQVGDLNFARAVDAMTVNTCKGGTSTPATMDQCLQGS